MVLLKLRLVCCCKKGRINGRNDTIKINTINS